MRNAKTFPSFCMRLLLGFSSEAQLLRSSPASRSVTAGRVRWRMWMRPRERGEQTLHTWGVFPPNDRGSWAHRLGGSRVGRVSAVLGLGGWGGGQSPSLASRDDAAKWVEERDAWSRLGSQLIRPQRDSSSVKLEIWDKNWVCGNFR